MRPAALCRLFFCLLSIERLERGSSSARCWLAAFVSCFVSRDQ